MNTSQANLTAAITDRIAGGLLGVHAGDSLGATLEFMSAAEIRRRHGRHTEIVGKGPFGWRPGDATDDTELTARMLRGYLSGEPDLFRAVADHSLEWYRGGPKDVGGSTAAGLGAYARTGDPFGGRSDEGAAGNGSLMRCITTGLVRADRTERLFEAQNLSKLTHAEPRAKGACMAYTEMVARLVEGDAPDDAVRAGQEVADDWEDVRVGLAIEFGRTIDLARSLAEGGVDDSGYPRGGDPGWGGDWHGGRGYVLDSLALSVAAVLDPRPFEEVVTDVVNLGGDTDTNGACAGGLVGVRDRTGAIPRRWVKLLQYQGEFVAAAPRLVAMREHRDR